MPLPPTVLVVTEPDDLGADLVIRQIQEREVAVHRIAPADLARPDVLRMAGGAADGPLWFTLDDGHRSTASASVVSVFWWHPAAPARWEEQESAAVLEDFLYGLEDVLWVNHPLYARAARPGPRQLRLAASLGLRVPPALFTNDPERAVEFAREQGGRVVVKTLTAHPERFVQARLATAEEVAEQADAFRESVCYLQRPVDKVADIRLTVVGERLFPCRITTSGGDLDWRTTAQEQTRYEPVGVSRSLAKKVLELLRRLGLEYAALDFAVDSSGTWWFLEANPAGQWGFVESATGMVISRALSDHLVQTALATRVYTPGGGHRASSGTVRDS